MGVLITADTRRCVGAGQCVLTAPHLFDQDDDGIVTLLAERTGEDERSTVEEASLLCPSQAISAGSDS